MSPHKVAAALASAMACFGPNNNNGNAASTADGNGNSSTEDQGTSQIKSVIVRAGPASTAVSIDVL